MSSVHARSRVIRKEPCPRCVLEGRDTAGDNLAVYDDGHKYCYAKHGLIEGNKEDFILEDMFTYEYLPVRGISKETLKFYDVKTKIDVEGKPISLGFKYPSGFYKVRFLDKKEHYVTGEHKAGLFGRDKFSAGESKTVTITEGEFDALSLYQTLGYPVVSVQSAPSAARDCAADRAFLNSFEKIYIAFDGDEHGRRACAEVAKLFDPDKVWDVKFTKRKDANEYLAAGERDELRRIWWNSKKYLPDQVFSELSQFETILDQPKKIGIPYPFKILTDITAGIRTGETVLITAQEKVGKTELMHFIEHAILTGTDENVAAFFLEETPQRHLQALAGIELGVPIHLPGVERPREEVLAAVKKVVTRDDRLYVYSHFGSVDGETFLDTIRFLATARKCRYILFDHISMAIIGSSSAGKGSEREAIDLLATRLEMMVKELDIALILVSHVNDFGQTRGSRWLTKVCDIQINATRDTMSDDPTERKTIRLSVPISRYPGLTGECGSIIYDRDTYSFKEIGENDNVSFSASPVVGTQPHSRAA